MSDIKIFTKEQHNKIYMIIAANTHPVSVDHFDVIKDIVKQIEKVVFDNGCYR